MRIAILLLTIFMISNISATDLFEMKKKAFSEEADRKVEVYNSKRSEKDELFNKALKSSWEEFETKVEEFGFEPKPKTSPRVDPEEFSPNGSNIVDIDVKPEDIKKLPDEMEYNFNSSTTSVRVNFFSEIIDFTIPDIGSLRVKKAGNKEFSNGWEELSQLEYTPLLIQLENCINKYNLNNWGLYRLVKSLSEEIYRDRNSRVVLQAFLLTGLGYNCKIGYSGKRSFILLTSEKPLYGMTYLNIDSKKFYIIDRSLLKLNRVNTYRANHKEAKNSFDFTIYTLPTLKEKIARKSLRFSYLDSSYNIDVKYNTTLINYLEEYPQTHYENYFNSQLSRESRESLLNGLKPIIHGKPQDEAVNILLHFTQKAFMYKTDQDQFNREKPLFPEEVLHYSYSDCEDRAVLFSYLVKELLSLKVVGLKYPSHMASAVELDNPRGDVVKYKNRVYTVADPTYINANIGNSMPDLKGIKPEIIGVN